MPIDDGQTEHCPDELETQVRAMLAQHLPPSPAKLFRVAAGLDAWSVEEQHWLDQNPRWLERCRQVQVELERADETRLARPRPTVFSLTFDFAPDDCTLVGKAKAECSGQVDAKLIGSNAGYQLWLFKGPTESLTGLRLIGKLPPGRVTLSSGGQTIALHKAPDAYGYTTVQTADIVTVIQKKQSIEVAVHLP